MTLCKSESPPRFSKLRGPLRSAMLLSPMCQRRSTLAVLLVLIFLSFFGTLSLSASMFSNNYDWRYRVISSLLSPRDNPHHYRLAASGLALAGVLMLPFAEHLRRHLQSIAPRMAKMSAAAFTLGIVALISACFVVPQHLHETLGIRRLHELLGRSAAGSFAVAMLCGCWCAWNGRAQNSTAATLFWIWSLVTVLPLIGLLGSEALLLLTRLEPWWAGSIRNALRHSVFWHLGFWEWTGAGAIFAFLCAAVFLMPAQANVKR